jgi:hypothetical protein
LLVAKKRLLVSEYKRIAQKREKESARKNALLFKMKQKLNSLKRF